MGMYQLSCRLPERAASLCLAHVPAWCRTDAPLPCLCLRSCIPKNCPGADWRVLEEIVKADPSREKFKASPQAWPGLGNSRLPSPWGCCPGHALQAALPVKPVAGCPQEHTCGESPGGQGS